LKFYYILSFLWIKINSFYLFLFNFIFKIKFYHFVSLKNFLFFHTSKINDSIILGGETMEVVRSKRFYMKKKYLRLLMFITIGLFAIGLLTGTAILVYAKYLGPPPLIVSQSTLYLSDDGQIIGESHSGEKRYWVELDQMSNHLVNATISIEDRKFYSHSGFDMYRIGGAIVANIKSMAKVQGASTITQQYAKNLYLTPEKSWKRKLSEAFYTVRLEMHYSKDEILEGYLNTIYYGHGAYGIEAASKYFFGKSASELNLAESTMLAGVPKGASYYSPLNNLDNAKNRQKIILQSMVDNGYLSYEDMVKAYDEELKFVGEHPYVNTTKIAPYFQDSVRQSLVEDLNIDERIIEFGGLTIHTTLNLELQAKAEQTISDLVSPDSTIQAALVAMEPSTGFVKALVGGRDYTDNQYNRITQASRQPGSTIKPLLYYAALENGFTPMTKLRSEFTKFTLDNSSEVYAPRNFNHQYANDDISMLTALAVSDNIYAVKTHLFLNDGALVNTMKQFGIQSPIKDVPSLALGTSEVRPIEMATAYSLIANNGKDIQPTFIKKVVASDGTVLYEYKNQPMNRLDAANTFVLGQMMTGMFDTSLNDYMSVTGATISKQLTRTYAGKSGSTNADNWMIGFSPQLVTTVWSGYDVGSHVLNRVERNYSKNIWVRFMETAHEGLPIEAFSNPGGTIGVYIDTTTGLLATKDCPTARLTYFKTGTQPTEYCTDHFGHFSEEEEHHHEQEQPKSPWYKKIFGR